MTRDDWQHLEPILTRALVLPASARQALIDTTALDAVVRQQIQDLLRTGDTISARLAHAAVAGTAVSPAPPTPAHVSLTSGDAIDGGRFVVVRQIGRGGMGTVYLAQDTTLGTLVALKIVPADDRLLHEAQRAAACSGHEHVATVHNVLRTEIRGEQVGVLVMEYVAGRAASRILEDGPVDTEHALRWMRQAAAAVAHAHDCEVLHCDIKPGNIIIMPDERVKVLDFGIARATFDPHNPAEPMLGTLPYMAPELLLAGEFSRASDVYSLGVTLFELLTGRLPFTGDDVMLRLEIIAVPPPRVSEAVPGAPDQLDGVIERALAKNPDERYRSARALARVLDEVSTAASNQPARTSERRPALASLWTYAAGFVAVSVAISLVLGLLACRTFDVILRVDSQFASSFGDYLRTGIAALLPLVARSIVTAAMLGLAVGVAQFVQGHARRFRNAWHRVHARLNLQTVATAVLVGGAAAWVALTVTYREVFTALFDLQQNPAGASVTAISAAWRPYHLHYANLSASLSFLLIVAGLAWLPRVARRSGDPARVQTLSWAIVALGVIVMLGPTIPRRFLFERFRVMEYAGRPVLEINRAGDDVLLYDPARRVTFRAHRDTPALSATESTQLLFTH